MPNLRHRTIVTAIVSSGAIMAAAGAAHAAVLGQVDDFEDLTTQDWTGAPGFYVNQASGGPGGADDAYLEITGTGEPSGFGSRIAAKNDAQWQGDYLAEGINAISVDLANLGVSELEMRLQIFGFNGDVWTSTDTTSVAADGVWRTFVFELNGSSLTQTSGVEPVTDLLAAVGRLQIRHQIGAPAGPSQGTPVEGVLGIDNITAIAVPAPAPTVLAVFGLVGFFRSRRR